MREPCLFLSLPAFSPPHPPSRAARGRHRLRGPCRLRRLQGGVGVGTTVAALGSGPGVRMSPQSGRRGL
eukprot:7028164-Pyramimonas_sp.AAC.1